MEDFAPRLTLDYQDLAEKPSKDCMPGERSRMERNRADKGVSHWEENSFCFFQVLVPIPSENWERIFGNPRGR
jgi:hypothetical protein